MKLDDCGYTRANKDFLYTKLNNLQLNVFAKGNNPLSANNNESHLKNRLSLFFILTIIEPEAIPNN